MKEKCILLLIFCDTAVEDEIKEMLQEYGQGYSYFSPVLGEGRTGKREATPVFPGSNSCFLALLPESKLDEIQGKIKVLKESFRLTPALSVFTLPAERLQ